VGEVNGTGRGREPRMGEQGDPKGGRRMSGDMRMSRCRDGEVELQDKRFPRGRLRWVGSFGDDGWVGFTFTGQEIEGRPGFCRGPLFSLAPTFAGTRCWLGLNVSGTNKKQSREQTE
jgi:hypothetical protein